MATKIFAASRRGGPLQEPRPSELAELLDDRDMNVWVSMIAGKTGADRSLLEQFGIHSLLIEDALKAQPSPKAEQHDGYIYLVLHALAEGEVSDEINTVDVDVFLGERFVVTHQHSESESRRAAEKALRADPSLLARGPASLAHRYLDHMIDRFLPLTEYFVASIDEIERAIVEKPDPAILKRIFALKHSLQRVRRIGMHQREIFDRLWRGELRFVPEPMRPFYRDVYDHFARVADLCEGYRDLVSSSLDAYLSMQSHQMNEVMKLLTGISTIMLPLTFITGLYGMNFDYMPLTHWRYGYESAWAVMLFFALAIYVWFRRKGWM